MSTSVAARNAGRKAVTSKTVTYVARLDDGTELTFALDARRSPPGIQEELPGAGLPKTVHLPGKIVGIAISKPLALPTSPWEQLAFLLGVPFTAPVPPEIFVMRGEKRMETLNQLSLEESP
jgi:hypothetical protein